MLKEFKLDDAAALPTGFGLFCDFLRQDDIADGGAFDWTAVVTGTIAAQATNGGFARISGAATTNASGGQIQALGGHACTDGKPLFFKALAQLNESTSANVATASDFYVGLFSVDTSIIASVPNDAIYFKKAGGGTTIACVLRVNGADVQSVNLSTVADKSAHRYGIAVFSNGSNSIVDFSIDGASVCRMTGVSLPAGTVFLAGAVAFQSADNTGTKWVDVDYVGTWQNR